jgi:hypothetical protein
MTNGNYEKLVEQITDLVCRNSTGETIIVRRFAAPT